MLSFYCTKYILLCRGVVKTFFQKELNTKMFDFLWFETGGMVAGLPFLVFRRSKRIEYSILNNISIIICILSKYYLKNKLNIGKFIISFVLFLTPSYIWYQIWHLLIFFSIYSFFFLAFFYRYFRSLLT